MTTDITNEFTTRYHQPAAGVRWFLCFLAAAAIAISSFLLFKSITGGSLPGCSASGTFDCDSVLATRWSHVLGVPVSVPAIAMYLAVLIALQMSIAQKATSRRNAWLVLITLSIAILAAAAWFIGVQVYLGSYCLYCMTAHGVGVILAVTLLVIAPRGARKINSADPDEPVDAMMIPATTLAGLAILGVCLTALLAASQVLIKHTSQADIQIVTGQEDFDTGKDKGKERTISILGGQVRLKPHNYPMLGSPNADHIIVYLFDYTCPNCRAMQHQLSKAVDDLGGKLGVVKLAVPLDAKCNQHVQTTAKMHMSACALAQLSTAVFLADPTKFHDYDVWLSAGASPPSVDDARAKAVQLVGKEALEKQINSPNIDTRIQANINVYGRTGGTVVPQFVMGNIRIFSRPDPEQMMALFKEHLNIEPKATSPAPTPASPISPLLTPPAALPE